MSKKHTNAHTGKLGKEDAIPVSEIGNGSGIDAVAEKDFAKEAEAEEFANQILTIRVAKDMSPSAQTVITPSVNGRNQPIIRGVTSQVKRKYVEALARSTFTRYEQVARDPSKPENIEMVPIKQASYDFTVLEDPHPHGAEWLNALLAAS